MDRDSVDSNDGSFLVQSPGRTGRSPDRSRSGNEIKKWIGLSYQVEANHRAYEGLDYGSVVSQRSIAEQAKEDAEPLFLGSVIEARLEKKIEARLKQV